MRRATTPPPADVIDLDILRQEANNDLLAGKPFEKTSLSRFVRARCQRVLDICEGPSLPHQVPSRDGRGRTETVPDMLWELGHPKGRLEKLSSQIDLLRRDPVFAKCATHPERRPLPYRLHGAFSKLASVADATRFTLAQDRQTSDRQDVRSDARRAVREIVAIADEVGSVRELSLFTAIRRKAAEPSDEGFSAAARAVLPILPNPFFTPLRRLGEACAPLSLSDDEFFAALSVRAAALLAVARLRQQVEDFLSDARQCVRPARPDKLPKAATDLWFSQEMRDLGLDAPVAPAYVSACVLRESVRLDEPRAA